MNAEDRWLADQLSDIHSTLGRIEGTMTRLPCPSHSADIRALQNDVSAIKTDLHTLKWWGTRKGKWLAIAVAALLAFGSNLAVRILAGDARASEVVAADTHKEYTAPGAPARMFQDEDAVLSTDNFNE